MARPQDRRAQRRDARASEESRSFEVELELRERPRGVRPGLVARVELAKRVVENAVSVPIDAIVPRRGGSSLFVVEDCRAVERSVSPAAREGDRVLLETGLSPGEELVVRGQRDLGDGQRVRTERCQ